MARTALRLRDWDWRPKVQSGSLRVPFEFVTDLAYTPHVQLPNFESCPVKVFVDRAGLLSAAISGCQPAQQQKLLDGACVFVRTHEELQQLREDNYVLRLLEFQAHRQELGGRRLMQRHPPCRLLNGNLIFT